MRSILIRLLVVISEPLLGFGVGLYHSEFAFQAGATRRKNLRRINGEGKPSPCWNWRVSDFAVTDVRLVSMRVNKGASMSLLSGLQVYQIGPSLPAAVCGRAFADLGASVRCKNADGSTPLAAYLNDGKAATADYLEKADVIVCEGGPSALRAAGTEIETLRVRNTKAVIVAISPFGQTGPNANLPATDLTLFCASGIARMLTGQVDDTGEPPIRPFGEQSAFIGGLAAACAGMQGVLAGVKGALVDVSIQEALATLAITEMTRASLTNRAWSRKRVADGNGATVCILPAKDGYAAISPRENHQWAAWLKVMGSPDWGSEVRFETKSDRIENWEALHALMSEWSRVKTKQAIADAAQAAHVPSFPLRELTEQLTSPQLEHRNFYRPFVWKNRTVQAPGPAYGLLQDGPCELPDPVAGSMPLNGVRVLDFSWVIAGPTTTRYLAAMGAEVIKVEAPGRGDPGRAAELHTVLGQAKKAIVLNLKKEDAVNIARRLAGSCDIVIENFGTGVMERFGLGSDELRRENPGLVYISASGLGRTGPEAKAVAYGTLLQCYAGFAGLNRHADIVPRVGMAWLDPMCGLKLAYVAAAAIWNRSRTGKGARIDFSMIEAMLWTLAEPLLAAQLGATTEPRGNGSNCFAPHGIYPASGDDRWVGIAVTDDAAWKALCDTIPAFLELRDLAVEERQSRMVKIDAEIAAWTQDRDATDVAKLLSALGVAAAPVNTMLDLVDNDHFVARDFWEISDNGALPGLPWQSSFGRVNGPAPVLGANTDTVLNEVLGLSAEEIDRMREDGAFG